MARSPGETLQVEWTPTPRRGNFRITFRISDVVTVMAIEHLSDIYRPRG